MIYIYIYNLYKFTVVFGFEKSGCYSSLCALVISVEYGITSELVFVAKFCGTSKLTFAVEFYGTNEIIFAVEFCVTSKLVSLAILCSLEAVFWQIYVPGNQFFTNEFTSPGNQFRWRFCVPVNQFSLTSMCHQRTSFADDSVFQRISLLTNLCH